MGILENPIPVALLRERSDGFPTETSKKQKQVEESIIELYHPYRVEHESPRLTETISLYRIQHIRYLTKELESLPGWMTSLDASKPWILYWILHSLDLLGYKIPNSLVIRAISTLSKAKNVNGGFGGGNDQISHLASTYAAINVLTVLGTKEAYDLIDRESLYQFLLDMKQPDGSFRMHDGGEIDIRGSYLALSIAALTNLLTPELTVNCADFIRRCQTYEGGIAPYPNREAHGGYIFCGIAALEILGEVGILESKKVLNWLVMRQMSWEGGFQGRTNKLVDGCYSFWGAGGFPIIEAELRKKNSINMVAGKQHEEYLDYLFDREALQEYILVACQNDRGGFHDKPGRSVDHYHTCYVLSGLSTSQHHLLYDFELEAKVIQTLGVEKLTGGLRSLMWKKGNEYTIVGEEENLVAATHPVHNVRIEKTNAMLKYFYKEDFKKIESLITI